MGEVLSGYRRPLLGQDDQGKEPEPVEDAGRLPRDAAGPDVFELVGCSAMSSYEHSPAPIFVVGRNSMCIIKWSPGMKIAAPTIVDPVGVPVTELPFVNPSDGDRFDRNLLRIFEAPSKHDNARTLVLYLRTTNGRVLLEMRADHLVTESEAIVVFTGRQVESSLACMMAQETIVAASESNANNGGASGADERSQEGSIKSDDADNANVTDASDDADNEAGTIWRDIMGGNVFPEPRLGKYDFHEAPFRVIFDDASASSISSLTMPTLSAPLKENSSSTISSLTMETSIDNAEVMHAARLGANSRARETLMRESDRDQPTSPIPVSAELTSDLIKVVRSY